MSFTRSTTDVNVHRNMPDYPSNEGYTAAQLKTAFDSSAAGLKDDLNGLMTELESSSSASNVGAAAIADGDSSDANVQAKLEKLYEDLQGVALGDIPDGTITKAKMDATYAGTIAEKDGTLQTNLSAEMLNGKTEAQLMSAFLDTVNPQTLSFTAGTAPTASNTYNTETEAKTMTTRGGRYYFMVFSYQNCKIALYDAQANKFIFGTYLGTNLSGVSDSTNTFSFNTTSLRLHKGYYNDEVSIIANLSGTTLTVTATKKSRKTSSTQYPAPSGTITVFELGGKIS